MQGVAMGYQLNTYVVAIRNILMGANLASLNTVRHPRQFVNTVGQLLFYNRALTGRRGLEEKHPYEVIGTLQEVFDFQLGVNHMFWNHDASYTKDVVALAMLCSLVKPKSVFEIGTFEGYTATQFAMNTDRDCAIFTLDLGHSHATILPTTDMDKVHQQRHEKVVRYLWEDLPCADKIHPLFGDSAAFDYSRFFDSIDLFFVDGAHSYSYVKSDTLNAMKCVRAGGVIVWHDYGRAGVNGVSKWLHEFSRSYKIYCVPGSSVAFMSV